ncbi:hypothetical protein [Streptomyces sp. NPDC056682]|uniref:hypothetical protein n=1 Tax=Streptomyces sp. NPDC056682 TaxID=3345909 RepID=UPI0036CA4049
MKALTRCRLRLHLLGTARLRLALVLAALAATAITLLGALPAHADPTPAPAPPAAGANTPSPEQMKQIEEILREQGEHLAKGAQESMLNQERERLRKLLPDEGGILSVFNVTDANNLPISAYTVKSDTGGMFDWDLGIQNLIAEICFVITKWLIAFCCWLIGWSLSFGLAKVLMSPVISVANSLHTRVIMEMGLPSLFLAVCALTCTARIFFGDRAKGWGDAALSLVLAALTTTLLASTPNTLLGDDNGAIAVTRGLALDISSVILDAGPTTHQHHQHRATTEADSADLARPLTDALTDAFIVRPAMLLQYGRIFTGDCADAYQTTRLNQLVYDRMIDGYKQKLKKFNALQTYLDPTGVRQNVLDWEADMALTWAADHFGEPPMEAFEKQCVPGDAGAAKKASLDKVGGAIFLLVAAIIVTVLLSGLAGSFLVAQCRIAWDAIRGEPALVIGTIPGAGRAYLWDWCASVLRSLQMMITSVIALAVFIVILQTVLDPVQTDWGQELTLRFLVVDLLCIAALKKRKDLVARSKQLAASFRAKMSAGKVGGTHGSVFTAPAAAAVTKQPRIGQATARGLLRGAMAGVALAHGNPLAAIGYAMPQTVGATALMSRISTGRRRGSGHSRRRPARLSGRPAPTPRPQAGGHGPGAQPPVPSVPPLPPGRPPASAVPPRPTRPPSPAPHPARRRAVDPVRGSRPRSASVQRSTVPPHRGAPGAFSSWLDEREAQELARRRTPPPRNTP